jgi:hypothetical protein
LGYGHPTFEIQHLKFIMNHIFKKPISALGYGFIAPAYIPKGKDEYYLRNIQHRTKTTYRQLTTAEIRILEKNDNSADDWRNLWVSEAFDPTLVKRCSFFGLIRIGKLEPVFHEFNNLRMPVGLYNSTIISCDFGDNVVVDNVNYMSHYIAGNDVMLVNINELATTDHSKFGNGVLKEGESESVRIWLEICNENAGRSVLPFNGMLAGDAWLWSRHRDDEQLQQRFKEMTDRQFDTRRGYYGKIGDRTVIKNSSIIKDVWMGSDAYIKGANKLKNLTINSAPDAKSQIGEGCELVNGIVGYGCRIFYGVKAVRFMMGSNSQLKYGARLINSYLGDNSTISCCEVLNSLIFPAHEQHHNNSFLCAATVMGQSNMAAGATIGSNHNSRAADGEIVTGRGFWPGLCVSLKHNSRFASYTLIAKGDFIAELDIPLPFSLVHNDVSKDQLVIRPGYWFMYNMYALARNASKHAGRDKRKDKTQVIEYDFLAPDTVDEIMQSLPLLQEATGRAWAAHHKKTLSGDAVRRKGEQLLEGDKKDTASLEILAAGFENSKRKTVLLKAPEAYRLYKELVVYYGVIQLIGFIERRKIRSWQKLLQSLPAKPVRNEWKNIGGQLVPINAVKTLVNNIRSGRIRNWDEVHAYYHQKSKAYPADKFQHAFASLLELLQLAPKKFTKKLFFQLLRQAAGTREWMVTGMYSSRAKDYENPFRKMVYEHEAEMEKVTGKLNDNPFIRQQQEEMAAFEKKILHITDSFSS